MDVVPEAGAEVLMPQKGSGFWGGFRIPALPFADWDLGKLIHFSEPPRPECEIR